MNDDARPGRPSTSTTNENTEAVKKIVMENHRIIIRKVTEDVGISVCSCHAMFSDILGLKRVAGKFVPKFNVNVNDDPDLLKKVITGDESLVYGCDVETKAQSSQWNTLNHQHRKKHVKFDQMSRFCSLFSLIIMA